MLKIFPCTCDHFFVFAKISTQFLCQFLIRLLVFFPLSYVSFLYVLDINPLMDIWFASIFSLCLGYLFTTCSFCWWFPLLFRSCLVWCNPTYLFFLLFPLLLVSNPKTHCQDQLHGAYPLFSLLRVLWFQVLCLSL